MAITTPAYVQEVGEFANTDGLTSAITRASIRVKALIGATAYTAAADESAASHDAVKEAETLLAICEALRSKNRHDSGGGINMTETGNGADGTLTTRYMTPYEIRNEIDDLTLQAERFLGPYLTNPTPPAPSYGSETDTDELETL